MLSKAFLPLLCLFVCRVNANLGQGYSHGNGEIRMDATVGNQQRTGSDSYGRQGLGGQGYYRNNQRTESDSYGRQGLGQGYYGNNQRTESDSYGRQGLGQGYYGNNQRTESDNGQGYHQNGYSGLGRSNQEYAGLGRSQSDNQQRDYGNYNSGTVPISQQAYKRMKRENERLQKRSLGQSIQHDGLGQGLGQSQPQSLGGSQQSQHDGLGQGLNGRMKRENEQIQKRSLGQSIQHDEAGQSVQHEAGLGNSQPQSLGGSQQTQHDQQRQGLGGRMKRSLGQSVQRDGIQHEAGLGQATQPQGLGQSQVQGLGQSQKSQHDHQQSLSGQSLQNKDSIQHDHQQSLSGQSLQNKDSIQHDHQQSLSQSGQRQGLSGSLRSKRYVEREPYRKTCNSYYGKYICYRLYENQASIPHEFTCWSTYLGKKNCTETENILYLDRRNVEVDPSEVDRQFYPTDNRRSSDDWDNSRRDNYRQRSDDFGAEEKNLHNRRNNDRELPREY